MAAVANATASASAVASPAKATATAAAARPSTAKPATARAATTRSAAAVATAAAEPTPAEAAAAAVRADEAGATPPSVAPSAADAAPPQGLADAPVDALDELPAEFGASFVAGACDGATDADAMSVAAPTSAPVAAAEVPATAATPPADEGGAPARATPARATPARATPARASASVTGATAKAAAPAPVAAPGAASDAAATALSPPATALSPPAAAGEPTQAALNWVADGVGLPAEPLRLAVDLHALRLDESVRLELQEQGLLRLWVEVALAPAALLPQPASTERVTLPPQPGALGSTIEMPLRSPLSLNPIELSPKGEGARALAYALRSNVPTTACMRLTLFGSEQGAKSTPVVLCEASVALPQLLRRNADLRRAPLQMYASNGRPLAAVVFTLTAVETLQKLFKAAARLTGVAPAAAPSAPLSGSDGAPSAAPADEQSTVAQRRAAREARAAAVPPLPLSTALPVVALDDAAADVGVPKLPVRLELLMQSLEVAATVCDDARVGRLQIAIDVTGLSEGAALSPRLRKPPPGRRTALDHSALVPIYDPSYAVRCVRVAKEASRVKEQALLSAIYSAPASAAASTAASGPASGPASGSVTVGAFGRSVNTDPGAAGASLGSSRTLLPPPVPVTSTRLPVSFRPAMSSASAYAGGERAPPRLVSMRAPTDVAFTVRLTGIGRGGVISLASATVSLTALLAAAPEPLEISLRETPAADGFSSAVAAGGPPSQPPQSSKGYASASLWLSAKVLLRELPAMSAPPPTQRANEPQVCCEVHSIRLPLRGPPPTVGMGGGGAVGAVMGATAAAAAAVAPLSSQLLPPPELAEMHTAWIAISMPGLAQPCCSETFRVAELVRSATLIAPPPSASTRAEGASINLSTLGAGADGRGGAPGTPSRTTVGRNSWRAASEAVLGRGASASTAMAWSSRLPLSALALVELYGHGSEPFDTLRAHLVKGLAVIAAGGTAREYGQLAERGRAGAGASPNSSPQHVNMVSPQRRATPREGRDGGSADVTGPMGAGTGVLLELRGAGRNGHAVVASLRLSLLEILEMSSGADVVSAPLRLRSPRNGSLVAEIDASITFKRAVDALRGVATPLLTNPSLLGMGSGVPGIGQSGAAVAVGAGEGCLLVYASRTLAGLFPTSAWLEVDLRRAFGTLLRSASRPAATGRVDFELRELLFVADASAAQRRLAAVLDPRAPAAASEVRFSVYCTAMPRGSSAPPPKPRRLRMSPGGTITHSAAAPDGASDSAGHAAGGGHGHISAPDEAQALADLEDAEAAEREASRAAVPQESSRCLLGTCVVSLRRILREGYEPLTEPLDLRDEGGELAGQLHVTLLAKDAVQRARRAMLARTAAQAELWVGAEGLALSPAFTSRELTRDLSIVWIEVRVEIEGRLVESSAQTMLSSPKHKLPRSSGAAAAAAGGSLGGGLGGGIISMGLRGCLIFAVGSPVRVALQRALKRSGSGAGAALSFHLYVTTPDAVAVERRPVGSARVGLADLIAATGNAAVHAAGRANAAAAGEGAYKATTDGTPILVSLRDENEELVGSLAVDVDGLDALRALAADKVGEKAPSATNFKEDLISPRTLKFLYSNEA